tara:strand:- start:4176 stop:5846 length:1671 start_codon:yes stop_codon:yes gene_type:complete
MANPYLKLNTSLDYGLNTLFNRNSAPQKMPLGAPQIQNQIGPDGFWDRQTGGKRGPVDPLQADKDKKRALEKNIITNQIQHVQYINMVQVIVPVRLPNTEGGSASWLDLTKSIHAGDVVFALRCPPKMVAASYASRLTKKTQYNYVSSVNLATLNYILFRLQTFFLIFRRTCVGVRYDTEEDFCNSLQNDLYREKDVSPSKWNQWKQWFNFLGENNCDLNDWIGIDDLERDTPTLTKNCFFKQWYDEVKSRNLNGLGFKHLFDAMLEKALWGWILGTCNILGIFIGSDEQGGSHQESKNPAVSWPNDYVGTVQCTGKSRRTSNLWNRDNDFSSGEGLGFVLRKKYWTGRNINTFRLSSNPNTAVDVTPNNVEGMLGEIRENGKGFYYYLCPATLYAVQRAGHKLPTNATEPPWAHGLTPTFWQFCCANQHSKKMTHQQEAENFATDALTIGNAPPIEIIMRRTFHDHTEEKIEYITEMLEDLATVDEKPEGDEAPRFARIAPSHASVTEPVHDLPMPDASAEDASSKAPSFLPAVTASKSKKREKKTLPPDDSMEP